MHIVVLTMNRGRGSGTVARDQAALLIAAGHRVTYMYAGMTVRVMGADNLDVPLHTDVIPVHEYLPAAHSRQQRVPAMSWDDASRYIDDYAAALDAVGDVDLILTHHSTVTSVAARRVAEDRGIPYVVFAHGTGIEPRFHGGFDDRLWDEVADSLQRAAGVIVTTEYVRDTLVRPLVPIERSRFLIQPCGIDLTAFEPVPGTDIKAKYGLPERYVICPGAITFAKGPQNVSQASKFYSDLAPTIFIGDGDLADDVRADLGDRGRLLGFVPRIDKDALIAAATVLTAAPVKREHFGIIYVEAMAAGTVPVAYGGGGVDTIVTPDVGVLTERSPRALGTAVRQMLLDDWQRRQKAAAARERALSVFSSEVLGARFVSWVDRIILDSVPTEAGRTGAE